MYRIKPEQHIVFYTIHIKITRGFYDFARLCKMKSVNSAKYEADEKISMKGTVIMDITSSEIANIVKKVISEMNGENPTGQTKEIPIGISNRHIHLTKEDMETLFGKGYELTPLKDLSQPGQYACKETLTLIGPSMRAIEGVRVLGPLRKNSQIEISVTDSFVLKLKPPVRESGDTKGSAPVTIIGPKGIVNLNEGCIIANRHIHMSPSDAEKFGVKDGDYVTVNAFSGTKKTKWYDVQIRVSDKFRLEMHIDTDDANATGLKNGSTVTIAED